VRRGLGREFEAGMDPGPRCTPQRRGLRKGSLTVYRATVQGWWCLAPHSVPEIFVSHAHHSIGLQQRQVPDPAGAR
jgi:hypothetical protein